MTRRVLSTPLVLALVLATSCGQSMEQSALRPVSQTEKESVPMQEAGASHENFALSETNRESFKVKASSLPYTPILEATESEIKARVDNQNRFAAALYDQVLAGEGEGNILLSPLSVESAFALLYPGTKPSLKSGQELSLALNFDKSPESTGFHRIFKSYLVHLNEIFKKKYEGSRLEWNLVNQVWVDKLFQVDNTYLDTVKTYYNADVAVMDFRSSPEKAEHSRQVINNFVEEKTNKLIRDLLPQGAISQDTSVVLTNSVYLLADWQKPFRAEDTRDGSFQTLSGEKISVRMMEQTSPFAYSETPDYQSVTLPYVGGELALVFVLPKDNAPFRMVEKTFNSQQILTDIRQRERPASVHLKLPKFTFSWGSKSLRPALSSLGLSQVWRPKNNFPAMGHLTGGGIEEPSFIDDVVHQTKIIVDEKGTEAAAATSITIRTTSIPVNIKEFIVDRPALFYLVDVKYGSILFMGRLARP